MTEGFISNPILPGFNPDPSIIRVEDDFFIATSTFEWFPGVRIHHSRDLIHWRLIEHPLTRLSQLDLSGNPDSGGIWAPCLSHDGSNYHLIYTDVKTRQDAFIDSHNYLVTAADINGPWSDPLYLNSSGFDPSLFHDDDGRKWLVNMVWDFRSGRNPFAGIVLQEFSPEQQCLVGPRVMIFTGSKLGVTEGPHLYKRNGYYYLMTAEGGTGDGHAVTMARSKSIKGPYEVDPENPILTSRDTGALLQKAGHASLVELDGGECYIAHLCSRPFNDSRRCILGRETAIQKCHWTEDGWLRLASGERTPANRVAVPDLPPFAVEPEPEREDFDQESLPLCFQTLRTPFDSSWASLTERPGWLRLYGRESTVSRHRQSLVARRIESVCCEASTCIDYCPDSFQQMAGLTAFYDVSTHYYLCVTWHEKHGRCIKLMAMDKGVYSEPAGEGIPLEDRERVYLRATFHGAILRFSYSYDSESWIDVAPDLDATILSDEYCGGFTGTFVGLCAQDLSGRRLIADFDWFLYRNTVDESREPVDTSDADTQRR